VFVQYKPKDGDPQTWDFVPEDVYEDDAELIERHYGDNWDNFIDGLKTGRARARRVLLWHLTRQTHAKLRFEDTPRFRMGEFTVEFSSSELRDLVDRLDRTDRTGLTDDVLAELDAASRRLQVELTDALLREHDTAEQAAAAAAEPPAGKAD
jgi:hypothetical protein